MKASRSFCVYPPNVFAAFRLPSEQGRYRYQVLAYLSLVADRRPLRRGGASRPPYRSHSMIRDSPTYRLAVRRPGERENG